MLITNLALFAVIVALLGIGVALSFSQSDGAHDKGVWFIVAGLAGVMLWFGVIIAHFLHL